MAPVTRREALRRGLLGTVAATVSTPFLRTLGQVEAREAGQRGQAAMVAIAKAFQAKYDVPGLAVSIGQRGQFLYEGALGLADRDTGERLTPDHLFRIASVSKPITSAAIFDLIERGKLHLADRVFGKGAVLGTKFGKAPYGRGIEDITIEHLLTHTCGGWTNDARDPMFRNPKMDHAALIGWTLDTQPLLHPPGQVYAYSNFGYSVLGRVVETLTGTSYAEHVLGRILDPCGIHRMRLSGNTLADREPLEVRYYGQGTENPYDMNVRRMDSHGGWLATASDLVTFASHVDGFPTPPDILRPETIHTMVTPSTANHAYAKGWNVNAANNWWHTGSLPGTTTILVRTASGFCWAALTNTRRPDSDMGTALDKMVWDMVRAAGYPA